MSRLRSVRVGSVTKSILVVNKWRLFPDNSSDDLWWEPHTCVLLVRNGVSRFICSPIAWGPQESYNNSSSETWVF